MKHGRSFPSSRISLPALILLVFFCFFFLPAHTASAAETETQESGFECSVPDPADQSAAPEASGPAVSEPGSTVIEESTAPDKSQPALVSGNEESVPESVPDVPETADVPPADAGTDGMDGADGTDGTDGSGGIDNSEQETGTPVEDCGAVAPDNSVLSDPGTGAAETKDPAPADSEAADMVSDSTEIIDLENNREEPDDSQAPDTESGIIEDDLSELPIDGTITVIDYGNARMAGDAVLVESDGHYLLMDTGYTDREDDIENSAVILYLKSNGIDHLDLYLSHYHNDHYYLLTTIMNDPYFTIDHVYLPDVSHMLKYTSKQYKKKKWYHDLTKNINGYGKSWEKHSYTEIQDVIKARGLSAITLTKGSTFQVGNAFCEVLWQCKSRKPSGGNAVQYINNTSLVTRITLGTIRYLTAGDIHVEVEQEMINAGVDLKADIVKTNHHSYNTSNSDDYYRHVDADWAFSTAGGSAKTISSFRNIGTNYVTLKDNGTITFTIRGGEIEMSAARNTVDREIIYEDSEGNRHRRTLSFASGRAQFLTGSMVPEGSVFIGEPGWDTTGGGSKACYYDENGRMLMGQYASIDGNNYYFNSRNGLPVTGWITETTASGQRTYYGSSSGILVTGWQKIGGKTYYFHPDGHMQPEGEAQIAEIRGVFGKNGILDYIEVETAAQIPAGFTGIVKTGSSGNIRYGYVNGKKQKGWKSINGKKYYLLSNGRVSIGRRKIGKKYYFFDQTSGVLRTGWITALNGKKYNADGSGVLKKGWQTISGKRYYFDTKTHVMAVGKRKIKKKLYFFDIGTGALVRNGWGQSADGRWYFTNKYGVIRSGWLAVNGKKYYLDKKTYARTTGFRVISKKKYYFDPEDGHMITGTVVINDVTYSFSSAGVLLKTVCETPPGETS